MNIQNLTNSFLNSEFAEGLGWVLLNSLWQFIAIAAIYCCFRAICQNARIRYLGGVVLMGMVVASFVGTSIFFATQNRLDDHRKIVAQNKSNISENLTAVESNDSISRNQTGAVASDLLTGVKPQDGKASDSVEKSSAIAVDDSASAAIPRSGQNSNWFSVVRLSTPYVVIVWALGVILFAIRPILGIVFASRVKRHQVGDVPQQLKARASRLAKQMGIRNSIKLIQSGIIQVPMVVGYFRPLIVLPLSVVTQFSTSEIDAILKHELAHIRRHDVLINFFQSLIETVFFYHPCVWWISTQIRIERENCCDDAAAAQPEEAIHLANALYRLEEFRAMPAGVAASGGDLESRIKRLVVKKAKLESRSISRRLPAAIVATLIVFAVSLTAIASHPGAVPPLEEFGKANTITVQSVGDSFGWKVINIADAKTVARIESHFPGYQNPDRGADPAGYEIDLQLSFRNESGDKIVIGLNSKLGLWNRGNGDFLMSKRLEFNQSIQQLAKNTRLPESNSAKSGNQSPGKKSLVKIKGSERPVEIQFDESTNTIIYRGSKKAVEDFGAILKKHNEATLQQKSKASQDKAELAQIELLKNKLARAESALKHSRMLLKKGFITETQALADEFQVKSLEAQLESAHANIDLKSSQAKVERENAKKRADIEQQIQMSRIALGESELKVAMEEYDRLKQLADRNAAPKSALMKARLELDRKKSELSILQLELDQIQLNAKSRSPESKNENAAPPKTKSSAATKFEVQILAAEIEYAKSALQIAIEKQKSIEARSKNTGRNSQRNDARLDVKRREADLRILELKYDQAKSNISSDFQSNAGPSKTARTFEIVAIELEYAKDALEIAQQKLELANQSFKVGESNQQQIINARQQQLLAEKNLRVLQVELDTLKKAKNNKKNR